MRTLFEISKSGLRSAERSLSVTSNNVVNADTPGYTRQRVEKEPDGVRMNGYFAGLGVNITSVNRLRNEMADAQLNSKKQNMGYMQEKARVFEQLEAFMATDSGNDLDLHISRLFDSFSELSADPQDFSVRNNLIVEAQQLTDKLGDMSRNIDRVSDMVRESAYNNLNRINKLLEDLDAINTSVKQAEAADQPDHSSLDLRVRKLEELSELVDFQSQVTDKGVLELRIGGIEVLNEDGASLIKSDVDDVNKIYRLRLENGKIIEAKEGKLGGDIAMYEEEVPALKKQLDQLAGALVEKVNEIHVQGYGLEDNITRNFFNPDNKTAADISIDEVIKDNHQHIAASSEPGEAGNGEIAAMLANSRNDSLISGRKLTDFSIDLISKPGEKLSDLRSKIEARDSEIQMLKVQQEQESGVNIDEELSMMIQYQNAYQGAAKVMASAQQMYDTLISIVR